MKTETLPVGKLNPAKYNPRKIDKKSFEGLKRSISKFGYVEPIIVNQRTGGTVIGGHQRLKALIDLGINEALCVVLDIPEIEEKALNVALNNRHTSGEYDGAELGKILLELKEGFEEFDELNFDDLALEFEFDLEDGPEGDGSEDVIPEEPDHVVITRGDLIELGEHRVLCGDSTIKECVERLMGGESATLLHADPPYGMGKERDGVENDNLYRKKLDSFQMDWWGTFRPFLKDNASAYIWGNALALWRLWFRELEDSELLTFRNEIVWDKKSIPGMKSDLLNQFPVASERCLFFQIGVQFLGKVNAGDYPEEYDIILSYLSGELISSGARPIDIGRICKNQMYKHWFTKSQFSLISEKYYVMLQEEYSGCFLKPWTELKRDWDAVKRYGSEVISTKLSKTRSFFDNTHDSMTDVWQFPRVQGEERHNHATPKPVAMMERAIKSSCPKNKIVVEPFCGSGSTLMGAEKTGRRCFTMELTPKYVQTTIQRWIDYTGKTEVTINGQLVNWKEYAEPKI